MGGQPPHATKTAKRAERESSRVGVEVTNKSAETGDSSSRQPRRQSRAAERLLSVSSAAAVLPLWGLLASASSDSKKQPSTSTFYIKSFLSISDSLAMSLALSSSWVLVTVCATLLLLSHGADVGRNSPLALW